MDLEAWVGVIGNVAIALSFLVALGFGVAQVRAASRDRRERLTIETINRFQTREFAVHIHVIRSRDMPKTMEELYALPDEDQIMYIQISQEMEMLGVLVAEGTIDIDLLERTLGDFVAWAWSKYSLLFHDMREKLPDPHLGEYFEWLANRIRARMRERPRAPAYA